MRINSCGIIVLVVFTLTFVQASDLGVAAAVHFLHRRLWNDLTCCSGQEQRCPTTPKQFINHPSSSRPQILKPLEQPDTFTYHSTEETNRIPTSMTILTPSPSPSTLLASTASASEITALLSPALSHSLTFAAVLHRLLSTTSLALLLRLSYLSTLLLRLSCGATWCFAVNTYLTCTRIAQQVVKSSVLVQRRGWKALEPVRRKLWFEFMVFVLGCGNALCLLVFWPGWILVAAGIWGVWSACR